MLLLYILLAKDGKTISEGALSVSCPGQNDTELYKSISLYASLSPRRWTEVVARQDSLIVQGHAAKSHDSNHSI